MEDPAYMAIISSREKGKGLLTMMKAALSKVERVGLKGRIVTKKSQARKLRFFLRLFHMFRQLHPLQLLRPSHPHHEFKSLTPHSSVLLATTIALPKTCSQPSTSCNAQSKHIHKLIQGEL